MQDIKCFKIT